MARKINVKLILELRDAGMSRSAIASTRKVSRNSVSDVFNISSTIFCTLYRTEDWVRRLGNGAYAESIVERYEHNSIRIETGSMNMRDIFSNSR